MPGKLVPADASLSVADDLFLLCHHFTFSLCLCGEKDRGPSDVSTYKATNSTGLEPSQLTSFNLNNLFKSLILKDIPTGIRALKYEIERRTNIQSIAFSMNVRVGP